MDVVVLLKRVPDTAARIGIAAGGAAIDPTGVEWTTSPYDEMALERAIQMKEASGGKVAVLSLGPPEAAKELRNALAVGADEAVLLVDGGAARDARSTAAALVSELRGRKFDLLLAGWKAVDTDDAAVPHYVAAALGLPCVTLAVKIEVDGGKAVVHRETEAGEIVMEVPLPAVITAQKGLAEPRYASLKGIMLAKKKPLAEKPAAAADPKVRRVSLSPPPARPPGRILGEGVAAVPELVRVLADELKVTP